NSTTTAAAAPPFGLKKIETRSVGTVEFDWTTKTPMPNTAAMIKIVDTKFRNIVIQPSETSAKSNRPDRRMT
ncbi:MAG TPA: hypothetical protein PK402_06360, partial [Tepidisphaeraceae bacterium]|nr:hypothetical protein [Tepidisphaeraceae bacterium]